MAKPVVEVDGEPNAWRLLVKVRNAMRDARMGKHVLAAFDSAAGAVEIIRTPTAESPRLFYERLVNAAKGWVELRVVPKEPGG